MAQFIPFIAAGLGGTAGYSLAWAYNASANFTASKVHGLDHAYPWPFWKPWFEDHVQTNATATGTALSLGLGAVAFALQRRLIMQPLGNVLLPAAAPSGSGIKSFGDFIGQNGPVVAETGVNIGTTTILMGLVRPVFDGKNIGAPPKP